MPPCLGGNGNWILGVYEKKKENNARMEKYLSDMFDSDIINEYRKYREQE